MLKSIQHLFFLPVKQCMKQQFFANLTPLMYDYLRPPWPLHSWVLWAAEDRAPCALLSSAAESAAAADLYYTQKNTGHKIITEQSAFEGEWKTLGTAFEIWLEMVWPNEGPARDSRPNGLGLLFYLHFHEIPPKGISSCTAKQLSRAAAANSSKLNQQKKLFWRKAFAAGISCRSLSEKGPFWKGYSNGLLHPIVLWLLSQP